MIQLFQLKSNDLNDVVAIHRSAFPGFFLTDLGIDVLSVLYRSLIKDKSTIVWGVKNNQELVAFFVATTKPKGLYKKLFLKNIIRFFVPLLISFWKNIRLIKKMIISIKSANSYHIPSSYQASLLSICVKPSNASKGLGKMLLNKLETELILKSQKGYYLTTDAENNDKTNMFYINYGFQLHDVYMQGKRKMNIYVKDIK